MEIVVLILLIWLISPLVLGVVCICQASELKRLRKQLSERQEGVCDGHKPTETASQPPKPENIYAHSCSDAPKPMTAPAPRSYQPAEKAAGEKHGANASAVIMVLGAMFITLAGFVFAAAAWGNLNSFFKSAVLVSFSVIFFAMHIIAAAKLKLETAGKVFFVLGSVLLPAAAAAGGILGVFGEWFSFSGEGCALVFMTMFLLLSGCLFVGTHIYKSTSFSWIAYASLCAALVSLMIQLRGYADMVSAFAGGVLLAVTLFEPRIKKLLGSALAANFHFFTTACTWSVAAVSLIISDGSLWFLIPAVLISASFMAGAERSEQPSAGVIAFGVYLLAGVIRGVSPASAEGWIICASAVMAAITLLGMMNFLSENVRKVLGGFSRLASAAVMISAAAVVIFGRGYHDFELSMLISAAVMFAQSAFIAVRTGGYAKIHSAISFCWLAYEISALANNILLSESVSLCILGGLILAYYIMSELTPFKKYFEVKNLGIAAFAAVLICMFAAGSRSAESVIIWLMAAFLAAIAGRKGGKSSVMLPVAFLALAYPVYAIDPFRVLGEYRYYDAYAVTAVIYCIAACMTLLIKPFGRYSKAFSLGLPVICLLYPFVAHRPVIAVAAAAVVYAVIGYAADMKRKYADTYGGFALLMICALGFEIGRLGSYTAAYISAAVLMILMFGVYIFPKNADDTVLCAADRCTVGFLSAAMPVYSVLMMSDGSENGDMLLYPCATLLMLFGCAAAVMNKSCILAGSGLMAWYFFTYVYFYDMGAAAPWIYVLIGAAVFSLLGRAIFGNKLRDGKSADFLSLSAAMELAVLLSDGGKYAVWLGIGALGLILLNLVRRENPPAVNKLLISGASLVIMPFWWTQPLFVPPEIIAAEWNIIPAAAFAVLIRLIYKGSPAADMVSFADAVICVAVLFVSAMRSGYAADAVILGAAIVIILFVSFALRQKRWFALAAVSAAVEAIFLTARLWNSRTWWIYLLAAGVILTAAGVSGEALKRKNGGEKSKLAKMMSGWRW